MAMDEIVVPGWSEVTADQMQEFFRQASPKVKRIGLRNFQNFLDDPNKYSDEAPGFISLSQAKKILGRDKVVTVSNFNKVWNTSHKDAPIFYGKKDFVDADCRNKEKGDDFGLFYYSGQSIRKIHEIIGVDPKQLYFCKNNWYLNKKQDLWVNKVPPAGYYLINLKGLFQNLKYREQEDEMIAQFGKDYERTNPHIFTEVAMTVFKLTGKRVAGGWYHRSAVCTADGLRVHAGISDALGWNVLPFRNDADHDGCLRVSVCQKWRT